MQATVTRTSVFDTSTTPATENYTTRITASYLDGVDESSTREIIMQATSQVSQDDADAQAAAELRNRVKTLIDYLDGQFPQPV